MTIAGWFMILGASLQLLAARASRRQGAPWRGVAVGSAALLVWGLLIVGEVVSHSSWFDAAVTWIVAAAVWTGVVLMFIDRRHPRRKVS